MLCKVLAPRALFRSVEYEGIVEAKILRMDQRMKYCDRRKVTCETVMIICAEKTPTVTHEVWSLEMLGNRLAILA